MRPPPRPFTSRTRTRYEGSAPACGASPRPTVWARRPLIGIHALHDVLLDPVLWIAAAITVVACIVRGFAGFGSAMLQMPVFALLYTAPEAVATVAGLGTLATLQLLPGAWRQAQWREVGALTLLSLFTIPVGMLALVSLAPDLMRRIISGFVLIMVLVLSSGWRLPMRPSLWSAGGVGAVTGLINGATGVGGPPVVLYMLAGPNSAVTNRANLITFYTFLNGATCLNLLWHGVFTQAVLLRTLALWPIQIASLTVGVWLFRYATDAIYRRIAMAMMLGVAVFGLLYTR